VLGTPSVWIGTKPRAYWLGGLGKRYEVPSGVWGGAPAAEALFDSFHAKSS